MVGSPPHTRGKVLTTLATAFNQGITPAYAGKRPRRDRFGVKHGDHPRIRGEKLLGLLCPLERLGSPPHTRGKVELDNPHPRVCGITPAYAGKSSSNLSILWLSRDHPRIRGEKRRVPTPPGRWTGSPPHTRGKVQCWCTTTGTTGITPAYAGKRYISSTVYPPVWDHPRIRGEKPSPRRAAKP